MAVPVAHQNVDGGSERPDGHVYLLLPHQDLLLAVLLPAGDVASRVAEPPVALRKMDTAGKSYTVCIASATLNSVHRLLLIF